MENERIKEEKSKPQFSSFILLIPGVRVYTHSGLMLTEWHARGITWAIYILNYLLFFVLARMD
jgi:hypothetical protein